MKRMLTNLRRASSRSRSTSAAEEVADPPSPDDTPETAIVKAVTAFCISGSPTSTDAGSEVLHLPTIVDSAESSPTAARAAASILRKQIDPKYNSTRPYVQYNAIMLLRILSDNPGPTFTRNLAEPKFVYAVKTLLREGKDPSVRQILGETLEYFEVSKSYDDGLKGLRDVWAKEKKNLSTRTPPPLQTAVPPGQNQYPVAGGHSRSPPGLPPVTELTARIAEAQTSASLLAQVLQSTPQVEVPTNELVKEFADRCRSASRSMVAYISADPPPDEDTLTTLIETNDLLSHRIAEWRDAMSSAQRTVLEQGRGRNESSRIVDVVDVGNPAFLENRREVQRSGAISGVEGDRRRRLSEVESPVSPVSPEHQISYRY